MNTQFPYFLARRVVAVLSEMVTAIRSRPMIVSVAALLIALFPAVTVFAGHETGTVPSYTGCLSPGGTIYNVAPGETPYQPCHTDHPTIHLSGGDITAVIAGTGLSGGGSEGAVSLSVDSTQVQTRIPGDCNFPGGAISMIDETGQVTCSTGPGVFYLALNGPGDVKDGLFGAPAGLLSLPLGLYLVNAKIRLQIEDASVLENFWDVQCTLGALFPSDTNPAAEDVAGAGGDTDFFAGATLSLLAVINLPEPGSVEVDCLDHGDLPGVGDFHWEYLRISATQLASP